MPQIKNILFPIDFSERACTAAPFVAALMKMFGARATLLHVVQPLPPVGSMDGPPIIEDMDQMQRDAQRNLDRYLQREFENLPVTRIVAVGDPATVVIGTAEAEASDLIMMPTHGYGAFRSMLLGSITSKVLHDAKCPVWTATHTDEPPVQQHLRSKFVMCAVDGSDNSLTVLRWASEFARDAGATLRVVHVIAGAGDWMTWKTDPDIEADLKTQARETIEKLEAAAGIDTPICVGMGEIGPTLVNEAKMHGADALIIGRGVHHEKLGRLRSHSFQIIRTAPCPVISI